MTSPFRFDSDAVYDDGTLRLALGLTAATLARARRRGHLHYARKGNRTLYRGRWILDWLTADTRPTGDRPCRTQEEASPCR
jgi:hypothetical protein